MPHPSRQELERAIGANVRAALQIVGDDSPLDDRSIGRFLRAMTRIAARPLLRAGVSVSDIAEAMRASVAKLAEEQATEDAPLPQNVTQLKPVKG